jgi:uncharacterized membrane protein (DUF4010 family)
MGEDILFQTDSFQLNQLEFAIRLLVATGVGFVIGLEREHSSKNEQQEIFAGVRTFVMVVLLGFLTALLGVLIEWWIFIVGFVGVIVISAISYFITADRGSTGATTEFVAMIAFLLGGITFLGYIEASLSIMVIVVLMLSMKVKLKTIIGRITNEELVAFIRFVVIALLLFPFLPDENYGPFEVINPREIGWVIVLTSGFGFAGYMLMKFLGSGRGILLTGIVGGFVSSTFITWVFSKKSKEVETLSVHCAVAILAASTVMVVRVFIWIFIFNQQLLNDLYLPLGLILIAAVGVSYFFYKKQESRSAVREEVPLGSPLNLRDALFFGIIYTAILLVVNYANSHFGTKGIFISSGIAALTDIDAITISMSKLGGSNIPALRAQNAILLATLCNTIVKMAISFWFGGPSLKRYISIGYGIIFLAGVVAFLVLNN